MTGGIGSGARIRRAVGFRPRPRKIVGTAGRRGNRIAAAQHLRGGGIGSLRRGTPVGADELVAVGIGCSRQRQNGTGDRTRPGSTRVGRRFVRGRQRHRRQAVRQNAAQFTLDVVCELERTVSGKVHAIVCAEPARLTFEVGTLKREVSLVVDKAVPDVDVNDTRLLRTRSIKVVEIAHVGGRLGAADRRQADPQHRHAFAFQRSDHVVDAFGIDLFPLVGVEVVQVARSASLDFSGWRGRGGAVERTVRRCLCRPLPLRRRLTRLWAGTRRSPVAELCAVVQAKHDDDGARLIGAERIFDRL